MGRRKRKRKFRVRRGTTVKRIDRRFAIKLEKTKRELNKKIPNMTISESDITSVIVIKPNEIENRIRNKGRIK